mmetsp:Transcript_40328/g.87928  ORF Transcript_40328/g.87928 Transcript_40328/m.87928 type:complete len:93 (-) Transcript_40328:509-787(-)
MIAPVDPTATTVSWVDAASSPSQVASSAREQSLRLYPEEEELVEECGSPTRKMYPRYATAMDEAVWSRVAREKDDYPLYALMTEQSRRAQRK